MNFYILLIYLNNMRILVIVVPCEDDVIYWMTKEYSEVKTWGAPDRSRTYDHFPIITSDVLPLSYRRLVAG